MIIPSHVPIRCISVAREYLHLESKVRLSLSEACVSFCRECLDLCCRKEICYESISSDWLKLIWSLCGHEMHEYDKTKGWLSSHGCNLYAGRPPVCYEFLCNKIAKNIPNGYFSYLRTISKIPSLVGQNALGNRHLVTLSPEEIKFRLDFNRLRKRIAMCIELFIQCEERLSVNRKGFPKHKAHTHGSGGNQPGECYRRTAK